MKGGFFMQFCQVFQNLAHLIPVGRLVDVVLKTDLWVAAIPHALLSERYCKSCQNTETLVVNGDPNEWGIVESGQTTLVTTFHKYFTISYRKTKARTARSPYFKAVKRPQANFCSGRLGLK